MHVKLGYLLSLFLLHFFFLELCFSQVNFEISDSSGIPTIMLMIRGDTKVSTGSTVTYSYNLPSGEILSRGSWSVFCVDSDFYSIDSSGDDWVRIHFCSPGNFFVQYSGRSRTGSLILGSRIVTVTGDSCTKDSSVLDPGDTGSTGGSTGGTTMSSFLSDENYIYTRSYQEATTTGVFSGDSGVQESVVYYDGLGRPKQEVQLKRGGSKEDVIRPYYYDGLGRESRVYLPYSSSGSLGSYRSDGLTAVENYYKSHYGSDLNISNPNPYLEKFYESSPLNRVLKEGSPGQSWSLGSGHEIRYDYQTNVRNEVRLYKVSLSVSGKTYVPTLTGGSNYYNPGELYKKVVKDEEWESSLGHLHTREEFTDKEGQVVLKRSYAKVGTSVIAHDTYYVYDDYGNLSYVLPPKSEAHSSKPNVTKLEELCYQYVYDQRNRLVEKQQPGKGREYIVYNKIDQPILTKDSKHGWQFTKYDALGRLVYTGEAATTLGRSPLQDIADRTGSSEPSYEQSQSRPTAVNGVSFYYTNNSVPRKPKLIRTIHYYDRYVSLPSGSSSTLSSYGVSSTNRVQGLPTVTKTRVLGTNHWITTVNYYDSKGRVIGVYSSNDYLGTIDIVKNKLDFVGKVVESTTTHKKGNTMLTTVDKYRYDHMGRLLTHTHQIGNQGAEVLQSNIYDDLGQLKGKGVGGKEGKSRLQTVDYEYNIRGWLTGINNTSSLGTDLFAFKVNYNNPTHGATGLYNGNISETEWRTQSDNVPRYYTYGYDGLNRIKEARDNANRYSLTNVSYDKNGNITSLERRGHLNGGATSFGVMDKLAYSYDAGNKLLKVSDSGNKTYGFRDGANTSVEYSYDVNGNMTRDSNKKITSIAYNYLNLPTEITFNSDSNQKITYIYSADGVKQRKIVNDNGTIKTTDYAGGYIYQNGDLQFIQTSEGYAIPVTGGYRYVYEYKDHLGDIRLSYTDSNKDGKVTKSEIISENNYYPFGLKHKGYNTVIRSTGNGLAQNYKYNGKELQEELGLDWYDYGARNYEASLGRWMNVDPLAEQYPSISLYAYVDNNPIKFIDPDGKKIDFSYIYRKNEKREYINPKLVKAFDFFAKSETGAQFLANYAEKGQEIAGKTYNKNGKYHNKGIDLGFTSLKNKNDIASARTHDEVNEGRLKISVELEDGRQNVADYIDDIGHEGIIHANKYAEDFSDDRELNMSKGIDKYILDYSNKFGLSVGTMQHYQERKDKIMIKYITPILQQYYKNIGITKTRKDIIKKQYDFRD